MSHVSCIYHKAFRHLDQIEQPERFAAWLKTMTANECKMWQHVNRRAIPLDEAEKLPAYASLAVEDWRRREREAEIRQAVDALPEKSRAIVTLHYLSGLSHREIGHFLGITANAVSQHLHRARRQLKEMLVAEIEEGYTMNKLSDDFAQEVLRRVTLFPMVEGEFITGAGEGDVRGLMIGVGERGSDESLVMLWMREDDLGAVVSGHYPKRSDETPKGRAFESTLHVLNAFGIEIKQAVLYLSGSPQCRAKMALKQENTELTVDMRPSDALGLAVRAGAPVYVEEPAVQQGNIGEDDVPVPEDLIDSNACKASLQIDHQVDHLRGKAWEIGLSPENMVDTIRYHVDEAAGTVRMWLEAIPDCEATFDLSEYAAGVQRLFELARDRHSSAYYHKKSYRVYYSLLDEDARIRIVPDEEANFKFMKPPG